VMHFAKSGDEALELLADEIQPTLVAVLSDINMPGMDGLTLLGEIKQRFPDLPVMVVTAYGDDERQRLASKDGAGEFFTKPVDFDPVKAKLRLLPGAPHGGTPPLDRMTAYPAPPIDPRVQGKSPLGQQDAFQRPRLSV